MWPDANWTYRYQPEIEYFPMTTHLQVFYFSFIPLIAQQYANDSFFFIN